MVVIMIGWSAAGTPDKSLGGACPGRARREREVDHHDAVLLDDADEQQDADQR